MKRYFSTLGILICTLLLATPALRAQDGLGGALAHGEGTASAWLDLDQLPAAADFDRDQKPDGALLVKGGILNGQRYFRIELHVTGGENRAITFASGETRIAILAFDVDHDGAPDIVVEKALSHRPLEVYLNDGHGVFHKARSDVGIPTPWAEFQRISQPPSQAALWVPGTRGADTPGSESSRVFDSESSPRPTLWLEAPRNTSATSAASSPRAPPASLLYLISL